MVQVQSSWFPLFHHEPATFVPNIFRARPSDFRAATMRVYRNAARPSRLEVLRLPSSPQAGIIAGFGFLALLSLLPS